jgi:hypothetical protein
MVTTSGPERQTILRTGGTCRRADRRSCHPLQKFSCSGIVVIRFEAHALFLAEQKEHRGTNSLVPRDWFRVEGHTFDERHP